MKKVAVVCSKYQAKSKHCLSVITYACFSEFQYYLSSKNLRVERLHDGRYVFTEVNSTHTI